MAPAPSPEEPLETGPDDFKKLLYRFDHAWQGTTPPRIEDFLPQRSPAGSAVAAPPNGKKLLELLIQIDLGYRWRQAAQGKPHPTGSIPQRPLLEDYIRQYSELGALEQLSLQLIG